MATIVRAQDISTKTLPDSLHCRNQELARVHAHCPPYTNWRACIPELLEDALLAVNILCAFLVLHPHQCYYKLLVPSPWTIKFIYIYIYMNLPRTSMKTSCGWKCRNTRMPSIAMCWSLCVSRFTILLTPTEIASKNPGNCPFRKPLILNIYGHLHYTTESQL